MNNRRSFFKQLALGIATLSAPTIFIPKLIEAPVWKVGRGWSSADAALFEQLPFYLARLEIARNADYVAWKNLLASTKWESNIGSTVRFIN